MDDLISRQALMKEFSDFVRASNNSDFARTPTWNDAVSLVESMPSAQPEIVRCRDCNKASKCYGDVVMRSRGGGNIYCPLEFCSEAERRTDDERRSSQLDN